MKENKALTKAYEMVYNDIINSGCGLMVGKYDAKNGKDLFIYGISTVMEWIAHRVSDEVGCEFSDLFTQNMIESEQRAQGIKCFQCAEVSGCWKGQHGGKKIVNVFLQKVLTNRYSYAILITEIRKERKNK